MPLPLLLLALATPALLCIVLHLHARRVLARQDDGLPAELFTTRRNRTYNKPFLQALARVEKRYPTPADNPPLAVGDECRLVHVVSPVMLVVDANDDAVVASWDEGCQEHRFDRLLVRRYRPPETVRPKARIPA